MIERGDILMLGITAGVIGSLTGGMLLALAIILLTNGANLGWILLCIGAPASALPGWILARKLAAKL
jgi:hypothetical protein